MKDAVRRIAGLLREYAREQQWPPQDFKFFFRVNRDWNKIYLIFVAKGFEGRDSFERYASVQQFLRDRLKDDPALFSAIGFVTKTFKEVEEGGTHSIGPDYFELRSNGRRDLLKRTVRLVASALTRFAKEQGWDDKDYWIYYSIDPEWDRVRFYYVARDFDTHCHEDSYRAVKGYLDKTLHDDPDVLNSLQLRVGSKKQLDDKEIHLEPGFKEYWTFTHA